MPSGSLVIRDGIGEGRWWNDEVFDLVGQQPAEERRATRTSRSSTFRCCACDRPEELSGPCVQVNDPSLARGGACLDLASAGTLRTRLAISRMIDTWFDTRDRRNYDIRLPESWDSVNSIVGRQSICPPLRIRFRRQPKLASNSVGLRTLGYRRTDV